MMVVVVVKVGRCSVANRSVNNCFNPDNAGEGMSEWKGKFYLGERERLSRSKGEGMSECKGEGWVRWTRHLNL